MNVIGIIPARFDSTRFPGKILADIDGKTMIRRVYEQASKSDGLDDLIVATDDERILKEVQSFEGNVVMTSPTHRNGTERCAEVADNLEADYILNIQGDEPYLNPEQIDELIAIMDGNTQIGTLIKQIRDQEDLDNPNIVKVVKDMNSYALYFTRQCIPYLNNPSTGSHTSQHDFWRHVGIYIFRKDILRKIVLLPSSKLEMVESLEQLRWLENGFQIKLQETAHTAFGIDSPDDLKRFPS